MSDSNEHGRQILSYWTPERMRAAEPEPGIEFYTDNAIMSTSSSSSHSQAVLDYWTPERLAAAQPEEAPYDDDLLSAEDIIDIDYEEENNEIEDHAVQSHLQVKAAGSLKIVSDTTVKTFPYQSVGKLFYTKVTPSGLSRDSYASAYVADQPNVRSSVYTAAHCLKKGSESATKILCIPGLIPPNTEPFGRYSQIPGGEGTAWFVHPQWDPNNMQAQYDMGRIILDRNPITGKYVDDVVGRIQILNGLSYTSTSEWNSIGFPVPSSGNPLGKMAERKGTFSSQKFGCVYKAGAMPKATSGGPWIFSGSNYQSNGTQVGNTGDYAITPYF